MCLNMAQEVNDAFNRGAHYALLAVQKHGFENAVKCYIPQILRVEPDTLTSKSTSFEISEITEKEKKIVEVI